MGRRPVVNEVFRRILAGVLFFVLGTIGVQAAPVVSSFRINNGAALTANPAVTLPNTCAGATSATHSCLASESSDFTSATWQPYASVPLFVLSPGAGEKTVYFKVKDSAGIESAVTSDTIALSASGHVVLLFGDNSAYQSDTLSPATGFTAVSAGLRHSLGLKTDGSITVWGYNYYSIPPEKEYVAISAGYQNLCLKSDGSIVSWGKDDFNQCTVPQPNQDFVAVSAGYQHNLGLKSDGSVVSWGQNSFGQCDSFEPNTGFVAVATGYAHSLALRADGSIQAWGGNEQGQCTVPEPNRDFMAIAAGWEHSLGLKADGSIVAWGYNSDSQCNVPSPNTGFVAVAAGYHHSLGLKADGTIVAWGRNDSGECNVPAPNKNYAAITGGQDHSLALVTEGSVQVALTPPEAVAAGARWRLANPAKGTWHDESEYDPTWVWKQSGDTETTRTGTYNLKFKTVYGWEKPETRSVDLTTTGTARVTAAYTRTLWTLETSCTHASIQVAPAGTSFPHETTVTLTVQPEAGYWFDRWVGDVPKGSERTNPLVLKMDADKEIQADIESPPAPPTDLTVAINNGLTTTINPAVTLANHCTGSTSGTLVSYMASESADFTSATWQPYASVPLFILSRQPGVKTVYFKAKDYAGMESNVTSDSITLIAPKSVLSLGGDRSDISDPNRDYIAATVSSGLKSDGSIVSWFRALDPEPVGNFVNLVGGGNLRLLGLRADGSLQAWGVKNVSSIPEPNENFVAIEAATKLSGVSPNFIGLKSDGSVVTWGGFYSRRAVPEPNREFVAVAAGMYHYLGLKSDGSVVAWGDEHYGRCRVPEPNTGFIAIAAGNYYSVGLKSDGSIVAWGVGSSGSFIAPTPNRDFVAISAGYDGYWGLKSDGSVVGMRGNSYMTPPVPNQGFVALGADESGLAFGDAGKLQVTLTPPEAVAAGAKWRLVGKTDYWWDDPYRWRESETSITRPVSSCQVEFFDDLPGWSAVVTSQTVTIQKDGLTSITGVYVPTQTWRLSVSSPNGSVAVSPVWTNYRDGSTVTLTATPGRGYRFTGWGGNITTTTQNPLVLTMDSTKTLVANFELYECYLTTVVYNTTGTVTVSPNLSAYPVGSTVTLTAIPAPDWRFQRWGGDVSEEQRGKNPLVVTMDADKTIRAHFESPPDFPEVGSYRINNGATTTENPTVTLPNFCDWATSSTHLYMASESADFTSATWKPYASVPRFTLSDTPGMKTVYFKVKYTSRNTESEVKSDTIMLCPPKGIVAWGRGDEGQRAFSSPGERFVAVSGGMAHSLGLKPDGSIMAWGENAKGQCDVPTSNTGFVALAAGGAHNLALRADGSIVAWGDNASGQCDLPTSNTGFVAVAAGTDHSLGLREDGTVVAWGNNEVGQCAVPELNSGFVAISAGGLHSLGLKVDGSIVAWGGDDSGQCTVPEPNSGFMAVAAGCEHSLGLKFGGSIVAWGKNDFDQCSVPAPNSGFVSIAAGYYHSLGLKGSNSIVAWGMNFDGQSSVPAPNRGFLSVAGGGFHSLALADTGILRVTLTPSEAVAAGAKWRIEGEAAWHESGTTVTCPIGTVAVEFLNDLKGWHTLTPTQTVTILTDHLSTASGVYEAGQTWTLSATSAGHGDVAVSPSRTNYLDGSTVFLKAVPDLWYRFAGWSGDVTTTTNPLTLTMDSNKTVTANFEPNGYALALVADPANGGRVSGTPNQPFYYAGDKVTVSAAVNLGFWFRGWWDGATTVSKASSFEYTMPASSATLTARFKPFPPEPSVLTVLADPPEGGNVSKSPDLAFYPEGSTVTLTAVPAADYRFVGWYDGATHLSTSATYVYAMEGISKTFTAKFALIPRWTLTTSVTPEDSGTISTNLEPGDDQKYADGTKVLVTAETKPGYAFDGWIATPETAISSPTANPVTVTMSADTQLQARFSIYGIMIRAEADPVEGGTVRVNPDQGPYDLFDVVTLTAEAKPGYVFLGWYDGNTRVSPNTSFEHTVLASKIFTAKFAQGYALTVTENPPETGTVSKSPDQTTYTAGTTVTLTATAAAGYHFTGWSGSTTSTLNPFSIVMDSTKTLTATFAANEYALTVEATNGTVAKSPDQATYAHGTTVTLTATAAAGYQFTGWTGSTTSTLNPLALVMDSTKTLAANFESVVPTSLTAVGNTYMVLVSWAPVTSVTSFVVTRAAADDVTSWTVTATEFADDTALPGVTYAYTVSTVDAQGAAGTPSEAVSASVTPETFTAAAYKVTAKGYAMTRDLPTTGGLTFTLTGPKAGTIKIAALKQLPKNAADNPAKGIYYLTNQGQVSTLAINGDVKTLSFDVPIYSLEATGLVQSVSAKSVTFLSAREFGKVSVAATKASEDGRYARTFIETAGTLQAPMLIKVTGAVVEELVTTQPVKLLNVASKVYKDAAKAKKTSLGAVGSLPKVVAEISNTPPPQSEATPCSIQGHTLNFVTVSDGPIVADELVGAIDKVTVSGGNLRAGLIQSSKNIVLLQATSKKGNGVNVGGAVGTAGKATALVVKAQPPVTGKSKTALTKVYGQTGVAGYFYAGYDASFQKGGIGVLQTKTGTVEGAAFLDPALVAKMKVLPEGQPIEINPEM